MRTERLRLPVSGQQGFTIVELIVVIAILGLLAAIGIGEFFQRRQEAYNKQVLSFGRNLLTMVATAAANDELPVGLDTGWGNGAVPGFPEFESNPGIVLLVTKIAADDVYQFHVAAEGGDTAYYFWLPGPACPLDTDADGFISDTIIDNRDVIGWLGVDWRTNPLLL